VLVNITSSRPNDQERYRIDEFLKSLLPRVQEFPGAQSVWHFWRAEEGESVTIIIWESEEAMMRFRESDIVQDVMRFEQEIGVPARREVYPLHFPE
jgi:heme-degrading monooxygenase HmoA